MHKSLLQIFEENPYVTGAKSRFSLDGAFELPTLSNSSDHVVVLMLCLPTPSYTQPLPKDRHDDEHLGLLIRGCHLFLKSVIQLQDRSLKIRLMLNAFI